MSLWLENQFKCEVYPVFIYFFFFCLILDGEKKAKKRSYEEIQTDEDYASQSSPPEPPQVLTSANTDNRILEFLSVSFNILVRQKR